MTHLLPLLDGAVFSIFFGLGPWEIAIVILIILLLFGSRLPSMMRSLGRSVVEFKKGVSGADEEPPRINDPNDAAKKEV